MPPAMGAALDLWASYEQTGRGRSAALAALEHAADEMLDSGAVERPGGIAALLVASGVAQQDVDEVLDGIW